MLRYTSPVSSGGFFRSHDADEPSSDTKQAALSNPREKPCCPVLARYRKENPPLSTSSSKILLFQALLYSASAPTTLSPAVPLFPPPLRISLPQRDTHGLLPIPRWINPMFAQWKTALSSASRPRRQRSSHQLRSTSAVSVHGIVTYSCGSYCSLTLQGGARVDWLLSIYPVFKKKDKSTPLPHCCPDFVCFLI